MNRKVTYCPNCLKLGADSKPVKMIDNADGSKTLIDDPEATELDCGSHCEWKGCLRFKDKEKYCTGHAWTAEKMREGGYPFKWERGEDQPRGEAPLPAQG